MPEIAEAWLGDLGEDDFDRVMASADLLSERGPVWGARRSIRSPAHQADAITHTRFAGAHFQVRWDEKSTRR